jgi:glycerophosphoryl diester phosphodiesterase
MDFRIRLEGSSMKEAVIIGHRGARFEAPENTLPGFRYVMNFGLGAVEFDVRLSADGELMVIHDETVDRTTNGAGKVADLTVDELRSLDARATFPEWNEPCIIPTLNEVLNLVAGLNYVMIEIKSDTKDRLERIVPAIIDAINKRNLDERVTLTSFLPEALAIAQREAPGIRRGYIGRWDEQHYLDMAVELGCLQVDVCHLTADHNLVAEAKSQGMRIVGWPTNSQEELDSVLSFEPHFFCTDSPALLRQLHVPTRA